MHKDNRLAHGNDFLQIFTFLAVVPANALCDSKDENLFFLEGI